MALPKKQYKNVYTILEKIKKGEIETHYKDREGLFGKIDFYKKPDLIKPHLHYIDEYRLENIMNAYMSEQKTVKDIYGTFSNSADFKRLDDNKKPDLNAFYKKVQENYKNFPKHLLKDIFKMYYNKIEDLDFEERDEKNHTKFKFLERSNNPVGKIMSEHSNLKSAIYARNILGYFITRMTMMDYIDPETSKDIQKGLDGDSDGDNERSDDAMKKMLDDTQGKKMMDKAMQEAQDLCKEMDKSIDKDIQEKMFESANEPGGGNGAAKLSPDYLRTIAAHLESVNLSMGSLKEKIKKLMDKSASYFSSKKKTVYEDLFNSDNVAGLDEYELLHPRLRKIFIEDVNIKDTKSVGKIDIYIDRSGSMSSGCGVANSKGEYISKMDFCKAFTAKLKSMDMLNNVYTFDNTVRQGKNDIISIAMMHCGGGTDIDKAVNKIEKNGRNALIITDAEDHCSIYSDKAFFIGVRGSNFSSFDSNVISDYSNKGQVVIFDGETIKKVNAQGDTV
jgi:uncharacterized protein with von Willebrand factor type A (vWA) domain